MCPGLSRRYCDAATSRTAGESPGENTEGCRTHTSILLFLFQLISTECLDCVRHCPKHQEHKQEVTFCLKGESERSSEANRLSAECEALEGTMGKRKGALGPSHGAGQPGWWGRGGQQSEKASWGRRCYGCAGKDEQVNECYPDLASPNWHLESFS